MSKKKRPDPNPLSYQRTDPPQPHIVALKPRPKLLLILSIVFALWVGLLLVLYFTTIYPGRH